MSGYIEPPSVGSGIYIRVQNGNFEVPRLFYAYFHAAMSHYNENDWALLYKILSKTTTPEHWHALGVILGKQGNLNTLTLLLMLQDA